MRERRHLAVPLGHAYRTRPAQDHQKKGKHMSGIRYISALTTIPLCSAIVLFIPGQACAGGFALNEMSAASVGDAHAGGAAAAEDPSTIYYNPAGLTQLSGQQFTISGSAIRPSAKFSNNGSLSAVGTPLSGGGGGDAGDWSFVPAVYYSTRISPDLSFGIGVQSPFGLKTDYDAGWVGRYQATKSELNSANINPAFAYRINDMVSIGGGVSAQYVDVKLARAIDFGSICIGTFGPAACAPIGFLPQAKDGSVTVKGHDWGYGYNFGVLFTPSASTRIGAAYRSRIKHTLTGDANFTQPAGLPAPLAAAPTFSDTSASAGLDLPDSLSLSGYTEIDPKWAVMADVTWMHWSLFNELRIHFDNGAADSVTPEQWRNTTRVSTAVNYRYNDEWKLRAGIAYDQSPVRDQFRTPRIPDANRTWLSFGAQFKSSAQDKWDIGYAHLFVKDASINKAEPPASGTLVGSYKNDVNILSVQYTRMF
jgi:long-chain fatty acid transport protein